MLRYCSAVECFGNFKSVNWDWDTDRCYMTTTNAVTWDNAVEECFNIYNRSYPVVFNSSEHFDNVHEKFPGDDIRLGYHRGFDNRTSSIHYDYQLLRVPTPFQMYTYITMTASATTVLAQTITNKYWDTIAISTIVVHLRLNSCYCLQCQRLRWIGHGTHTGRSLSSSLICSVTGRRERGTRMI